MHSNKQLQDINRITVEFKWQQLQNSLKSTAILIESQWNLNTESGSAPAVSCLY